MEIFGALDAIFTCEFERSRKLFHIGLQGLYNIDKQDTVY